LWNAYRNHRVPIFLTHSLGGLEKAVKLGSKKAHLWMAFCRLDSGEHAQANQCFSLFRSETSAEEQRDVEQAVRQFERFRQASLNYQLGQELLHEGRHSDALNRIQEALTHDPQNPYWVPLCYLNMSECHYKLNAFDPSLGCIRQAEECGLQSPKLLKLKGDCFQKKNHIEDAMGCYREAFVLKPDFPDLFEAMVRAAVTPAVQRHEEEIGSLKRRLDELEGNKSNNNNNDPNKKRKMG